MIICYVTCIPTEMTVSMICPISSGAALTVETARAARARKRVFMIGWSWKVSAIWSGIGRRLNRKYVACVDYGAQMKSGWSSLFLLVTLR